MFKIMEMSVILILFLIGVSKCQEYTDNDSDQNKRVNQTKPAMNKEQVYRIAKTAVGNSMDNLEENQSQCKINEYYSVHSKQCENCFTLCRQNPAECQQKCPSTYTAVNFNLDEVWGLLEQAKDEHLAVIILAGILGGVVLCMCGYLIYICFKKKSNDYSTVPPSDKENQAAITDSSSGVDGSADSINSNSTDTTQRSDATLQEEQSDSSSIKLSQKRSEITTEHEGQTAADRQRTGHSSENPLSQVPETDDTSGQNYCFSG